jgi:tetratricopeptide (TPR) repeat protein
MSHQAIILHLLFLSSCVLVASASAQTSEQQSTLTAEQHKEEGNKYLKEEQYDKAVDAYRLAIKLNPNLAAAYHGLGSAYVNMGRVADALDPMRTAVRLDPNNAIAHLNLGITLASLRRPDEALTELNEAKRLSPNSGRVHNEIGNVLHNSFGRMDDALAEYIEARRLNPNVQIFHHNVGLMLMRLGRFTEAVGPFQEALRLDPRYTKARYFLSEAYSKVGRYDKAVESWTKFLELVPNDPDALTKRSWNFLYEGAHGREAAADARKFLDLHGWRDEFSPYLAVMASLGYRAAGMNDEAQAILEEATEKGKTGSWPYNIIRHLKGEVSGDELLRLATDNDKKTEAHAYMGMDLLLKGTKDEARMHFEWVKEYGNKRFFEYPLAIEELKRLE